jgi:hypothetical protein
MLHHHGLPKEQSDRQGQESATCRMDNICAPDETNELPESWTPHNGERQTNVVEFQPSGARY